MSAAEETGDRERVVSGLRLDGQVYQPNDDPPIPVNRDLRERLSEALDDVLPEAGFEGLFEDVFTRLLPLIAAERAEAWGEGYRSGKSNAMRRMSDEPNAPTTANPYRAALTEARDESGAPTC